MSIVGSGPIEVVAASSGIVSASLTFPLEVMVTVFGTDVSMEAVRSTRITHVVGVDEFFSGPAKEIHQWRPRSRLLQVRRRLVYAQVRHVSYNADAQTRI